MDIDYVVDKKGNKYQIKTDCVYGAILTTYTVPELKPIDSMGIAPDGYIFSKWRDPEYRGSDAIDAQRMVKFVEAYKEGLFLPDIDRIFGYIHPSNLASSKWVLSRGGYMDGKQKIDGVEYEKFVVPIESMVKVAEGIKEKCLTK